MASDSSLQITLIGTGTIGLSFAAFHLSHLPSASQLIIYDPRPDLPSYISSHLPKFSTSSPTPVSFRIRIATSLQEAVATAHIIQESGPEDLVVKQELWKEVEQYAPQDALLWSSTSGIPASAQSEKMTNRGRLVVVHPYNPPHIMPLLEVVPSPATHPEVLERTQEFWHVRGRVPIVLKKEITGFVANRLAFALLREAIHLVNEGVVGVAELDRIVESSMGPRWAIAGPFKSYAAGGGEDGLEGFFRNIGGTVQECWDDAGRIGIGDGSGWEERVSREAREVYGTVDIRERDEVTWRVLSVIEEEKGKRRKGEGGPARPSA